MFKLCFTNWQVRSWGVKIHRTINASHFSSNASITNSAVDNNHNSLPIYSHKKEVAPYCQITVTSKTHRNIISLHVKSSNSPPWLPLSCLSFILNHWPPKCFCFWPKGVTTLSWWGSLCLHVPQGYVSWSLVLLVGKPKPKRSKGREQMICGFPGHRELG